MNWIKIVANGGFTFFSTLAGLLTFDGIVGGEIPLTMLIFGSLVSSSIQFGASAFKEAVYECNEDERKKKQDRKTKEDNAKFLEDVHKFNESRRNSLQCKFGKILSNMLLF